jgi:hypothetical protein
MYKYSSSLPLGDVGSQLKFLLGGTGLLKAKHVDKEACCVVCGRQIRFNCMNVRDGTSQKAVIFMFLALRLYTIKW